MTFSESQYLTAVYSFPYFGPARTNLLLSYFKSAKNIWTVTRTDLIKTGLKEEAVESFLKYREAFDIGEYFKKLKALNIHTSTTFDNDYPENLKGLSDSPCVLYIRGELKRSDSQAVAIVGTRMMTSYGREVAEKFATQLANYGVTVVSGLALEVDATAQRAAYSAGGRTVGVLASGLDIISPISNKSLALEFIKKNGALVSEYPLAHEPKAFEFPVRDRLIAAFAKAVIVIEGRMKSGTFYTVKAAADYGRPVFAVPGPITSPASEGPNYLIKNGARIITDARDVVEELDLQFKVDNESVEKAMPSDEFERKITEVLEPEPLHLDELVRITGFTIGDISARLTIMEMKGLVKSLGGGVYKRI